MKKSNVKSGTKKGNWRRISHRWHRRIGVFSAILVIILAVTGVMLSHADRFDLYETTISARWLPKRYAPLPDAPIHSFITDLGYVVWLDHGLYLDEKPLDSPAPPPVGALFYNDMLVVAAADNLALFRTDGQTIDSLGPASLPGSIIKLGQTTDGTITLETDTGTFSSTDFFSWTAGQPAVRWSHESPVPPHLNTALLNAYGARGVPLHRIIADLHSGRIFGSYGPLVMDAAAIALLLLSLTGLYQWLRGKNRRKEKSRTRNISGPGTTPADLAIMADSKDSTVRK